MGQPLVNGGGILKARKGVPFPESPFLGFCAACLGHPGGPLCLITSLVNDFVELIQRPPLDFHLPGCNWFLR